LWRTAADVKRHPGRRQGRTTTGITGGNGFASGRVGLGVHLVGGRAGELDQRPAVARERAGIVRLAGHGGPVQLRSGRVAWRARDTERIRLGFQAERAILDQRIGVGARGNIPEAHGDVELHPTQCHAGAAFLGGIEGAVTRNLRGHVSAVLIGHLVLGAAGKGQLVRLAVGELVGVVGA